MVTERRIEPVEITPDVVSHLAHLARSLGISRIYLDSRDTAVGFYRQVGFTFLTSVPCWIEVEALCS